MRAQWQRVRQEWRQNRRLRLGALVVVLIVGAHAALTLFDQRQAIAEEYRRDAELLSRLDEASREKAWPSRARAAGAMLKAVRTSVPPVANDGLAQAELQAWLGERAAAAGLLEARVRVEDTVSVPDHEDLWQVLARLDAAVPDGQLPVFLRALADALPWVQIERLEITEAKPTRLGVVVRAYYRKATAAEAKAAEAQAKAEAAAALGIPQPPGELP